MLEIVIETWYDWWHILVPILLILLIAHQFGLLASVVASESYFPGGIFFYKDFQKGPRELAPVFGDINSDIAEF